MEIGERTVIELGIHGLHKELVRIVGKMRFRSSYGQNLLMHSREVANLCGIMAAELGLNPKLAKRAGLLHDIGKVPDEESELSHALLGAKLAEKYGENPAVVNAIGAHHDEMEMQYVISPSYRLVMPSAAQDPVPVVRSCNNTSSVSRTSKTWPSPIME